MSRLSILLLSAVLLCDSGSKASLGSEPNAFKRTDIPPIRLQFAGPIAFEPPSATLQDRDSRYVLMAAMTNEVINAVFESQAGAGERFWAHGAPTGFMNPFRERPGFLPDQLHTAKTSRDITALLGIRELIPGTYWLVCNGKKGADFRAYQIFEFGGAIKSIFVNTGKPMVFRRAPIRPIRLQFAGPVSVVPSPGERGELIGAFKEEVINGVFEAQVDRPSEKSERLWANGDASGFVHPFHERPSFSLDRLREAKTMEDLEALAGKPEWIARPSCWLVCNGEQGTEFRAYQIMVQFEGGGGWIESIDVNTGKPVP